MGNKGVIPLIIVNINLRQIGSVASLFHILLKRVPAIFPGLMSVMGLHISQVFGWNEDVNWSLC